MATGVGCGRICLTSFNSPTPKTTYWAQTSPWYFLIPIQVKLWPFCPTFRCHGNQGVFLKFLWRHSIAWPRKPPVRRKDLGDISHTSRVIVVFVSNFVAMATGVGSGRICLTSFNSPTPQNPLLGANISVIFPIQFKLLPILSQIALPWQPGSVFSKFLWRHSIDWPRKPPVTGKDLGDISYTSRVIADFVSNFVAMATGVIRK